MSHAQKELRDDPVGSLRQNSSFSRSTSRRNTSTPAVLGHQQHISSPTDDDAFLDSPLRKSRLNEEPATPSSVVAEFGDQVHNVVPSAAELVTHVYRSVSQSPDAGHRSQSTSRSKKAATPRASRDRDHRDSRRDRSRDRSIAAVLSRDDHNRPHSSTRRASNVRDYRLRGLSESRERSASVDKSNNLANERINRFLQSMQPPPEKKQPPSKEEIALTAENKGLYQRVAALQLTERELLAENQKLSKQLATANQEILSLREQLAMANQQHEAHITCWRRASEAKEAEHAAKLKEATEQLAEISAMQPGSKKFKPLVTNEEIATWFSDQDSAWRAFSRAYGHTDPFRLSSLHPAQMQELCGEVKGFVQLTNLERLPPAMLHGGREAVHSLLQGMLANFFCKEILGDQFWVFKAAALGTLESPAVSLPPSAVDFNMDPRRMSTLFMGDVAPLRSGGSITGTLMSKGSNSSKTPLRLTTSAALGAGGGNGSFLGLPTKEEMERLQYMLADAQTPNPASQLPLFQWRAQLLRLFATGGMSLPLPSSSARSPRSASRTAFIETRRNHARKLREHFLGSPARFLLNDQDPAGIERLERVLMEMIDEALRFSCKLWSRVGGVRIRDWKALSEFKGGYKSGLRTVGLCQAQDRLPKDNSQDWSFDDDTEDYENEGRPVIMVVQPAVEAVEVDGNADGTPLVWLKARVMVAAPVEDPVPGSGASDAGFAPSPVSVRLNNSPFGGREGNGMVTGASTPRAGAGNKVEQQPTAKQEELLILPASSYTG